MSDAMVKYKAGDGCDVKLTPAIVARYVVTGNAQASDKDVYSFMMRCQARGLNPLAGDAYMTCFKGQHGTSCSVIVSKDYFVRTATQQPDYDGMQAGVTVVTKDGELVRREGSLVLEGEQLVGGWAEVHDKRRSIPSKAEVSLAEYNQHRSLWKTMPSTMIRKVAIVQALREAYPGKFSGVYDSAEMPEPVAPAPEPTAPEPDPVEAVPVDAEPEPEQAGYTTDDINF